MMCDRTHLRQDTVTGTVKMIDPVKRFGFIRADYGQDLYFRTSSLCSGLDRFPPGTRVRFRVISPPASGLKPAATRIETYEDGDDLRRARERIEIARENLRRLDGASGERIELMRTKLAEELQEAERDAAWLAVDTEKKAA